MVPSIPARRAYRVFQVSVACSVRAAAEGVVEFSGAQAEETDAACRGGACLAGGAGVAVGAGELDDDGVTVVLADGVPAGAGVALRAAGLAGFPVDPERGLVVAGAGPGLG